MKTKDKIKRAIEKIFGIHKNDDVEIIVIRVILDVFMCILVFGLWFMMYQLVHDTVKAEGLNNYYNETYVETTGSLDTSIEE